MFYHYQLPKHNIPKWDSNTWFPDSSVGKVSARQAGGTNRLVSTLESNFYIHFSNNIFCLSFFRNKTARYFFASVLDTCKKQLHITNVHAHQSISTQYPIHCNYRLQITSSLSTVHKIFKRTYIQKTYLQ